jgi:hypothetical protein
MDELERDLRSTLGELADGPEPSDDLVNRTVGRSGQIRRRRRVITVSSIAAAVVATLAVVSIAGAATRHGQVDVSGPSTPDDSTTILSTTSVPLLFSTSTTNPPPRSSTVPAASTTTLPKCLPPPPVDDNPSAATFTLLGDGSIEVTIYSTFGPARESHYFVFDNGTNSATTVYTPDQFGPHWYETWSQVGGSPEDMSSCKQRHNFVVDPSMITPTTTSTTVPGATTIPVETTIPETTTSTPSA